MLGHTQAADILRQRLQNNLPMPVLVNVDSARAVNHEYPVASVVKMSSTASILRLFKNVPHVPTATIPEESSDNQIRTSSPAAVCNKLSMV